MSETLEPRVDQLEREAVSVALTVKKLAEEVEKGFQAIQKSTHELGAEVNRAIKLIAAKTDNIGKPNYNAIGVGFVIIVAVLGYYVSAQIGPLRETIVAEKEARIRADDFSTRERDNSSASINALANSVVSNNPAARLHFMQRIDAMDVRLAKLETWDEARKLWKDETP